MNNIEKFNGKYLKCIVTKYLSATSDKYLGNSGSLIIVQPELGKKINRNYVYLGDEFLASGYGFSSEEVQIKAEQIVNEYDETIQGLKDTDTALNEKIDEEVEKINEELKKYVLIKGGHIEDTIVNIQGKNILTKDIILYGEEADYKNLEINDIKVTIVSNNNSYKLTDNTIFLPIGTLIKTIRVEIDYKLNDSGGIKKLQVVHHNMNINGFLHDVIINYDDTQDNYEYDTEYHYGKIFYEKQFNDNERIYVGFNELDEDGLINNIKELISAFYIHVKGTPNECIKYYPLLKEQLGIEIKSEGNKIRDNKIEVSNAIIVRPQFYMHWSSEYNYESFANNNAPLNSFKDYDETVVIIDNLITENTKEAYFAIPQLFTIQKIFIIKDNIEKYNWTGVTEIINSIKLRSHTNVTTTSEINKVLDYNIYRIYSENKFIQNNLKIELHVVYNYVKQKNDADYGNIDLIDETIDIKNTIDAHNIENTSILVNDEEFNSLYWVNGGNFVSNSTVNPLKNKLNVMSVNCANK